MSMVLYLKGFLIARTLPARETPTSPAENLHLIHPLVLNHSCRPVWLLHRDHRASLAKQIKMIAPPLRHPDPLIPMRAAMVCAPHTVCVVVGQGAFDGVNAPLARLV